VVLAVALGIGHIKILGQTREFPAAEFGQTFLTLRRLWGRIQIAPTISSEDLKFEQALRALTFQYLIEPLYTHEETSLNRRPFGSKLVSFFFEQLRDMPAILAIAPNPTSAPSTDVSIF
jgi:hypothetical protein